MTSTSTSPNQMRRHGRSGSQRSTRSSRSTHAQWSRHTSDLKTTTILRSLNRLGSTSAISIALRLSGHRRPRDEQFGAVRQLLDDGIIRYAGLSEVSVADIEAARRVFPVATVQNRYNLVDRASEDVLAYCAANNIGFIPWFPLAAGELTRPGGLVDRIASAHGATTGQVALAWLLQRSPVILPIPGTLRVAHLEENVAAAGLSLTSEEIAELDAAD